jgi:uncharacterized membrane protein SpoIIM required for sporulation
VDYETNFEGDEMILYKSSYELWQDKRKRARRKDYLLLFGVIVLFFLAAWV